MMRVGLAWASWSSSISFHFLRVLNVESLPNQVWSFQCKGHIVPWQSWRSRWRSSGGRLRPYLFAAALLPQAPETSASLGCRGHRRRKCPFRFPSSVILDLFFTIDFRLDMKLLIFTTRVFKPVQGKMKFIAVSIFSCVRWQHALHFHLPQSIVLSATEMRIFIDAVGDCFPFSIKHDFGPMFRC